MQINSILTILDRNDCLRRLLLFLLIFAVTGGIKVFHELGGVSSGIRACFLVLDGLGVSHSKRGGGLLGKRSSFLLFLGSVKAHGSSKGWGFYFVLSVSSSELLLLVS